jgi:hypothetical protein
MVLSGNEELDFALFRDDAQSLVNSGFARLWIAWHSAKYRDVTHVLCYRMCYKAAAEQTHKHGIIKRNTNHKKQSPLKKEGLFFS